MTDRWFGNSAWAQSAGGARTSQPFNSVQVIAAYSSSETSCTDSGDCASGFACVGGVCVQADPTGATGDSGTAGCGAGPGGDGGQGGGGTGSTGCGGPAASSGGGASITIQSCTTSSAGSCEGGRGISAGSGGGGGGGAPCGGRCCSCGRNGCQCTPGPCPPQPPSCSRFCTEAVGLGANVMSCGPKQCGQCQYCEDGDGGTSCQQDRAGADCRCGYACPGCGFYCNWNGNCLQGGSGGCPPPKPPGGGDACEPNCRTVWDCDESGDGCVTRTECDDLPPQCKPCDCNCNDECPDCQICNAAGKCVTSPECADKLYRTKWEIRGQEYTYFSESWDPEAQTCYLTEPVTRPAPVITDTTVCGPLPHTLEATRLCSYAFGTFTSSNGCTNLTTNAGFGGSTISGQWRVKDGDGNYIGTITSWLPTGWTGFNAAGSTVPGCPTPTIIETIEC